MSKPFYTKLMDQAIKFLEENSSFQRINFKIQIKRAQLLLDTGDFKTLEPLLDELVASCFLPNGKEDAMKSHLLIDLYALQIQLYSALDDMRKLQQLCGMINFSDRNISHPRVLGVIMKCCGKVKLLNSDYAGAKNDFFDAFKSFDEAGLDERFDALKLVVLTHMLSGSKIDIFQGQEVKAYQSHEKLVSIYELYTAFNANNVVLFVEKLHASGEEFYKDSYISGYAQILVETAQKNLLRRIVSCYKRIKLSTLAKELMLEEDTLELLVLKMIFDQTLEAKIDQFDRHLVMTEATLSVTKKYLAFSEMAKSLQVAIKP
ncbi:PCI domain containing protein [Entamoeba marina]